MAYRDELATIGQRADDDVTRLGGEVDRLNQRVSDDMLTIGDLQAKLAAAQQAPPSAPARPYPSPVRPVAFYKPTALAQMPADTPFVMLTHNDESVRDGLPSVYGRVMPVYIVGCECEGPSACPFPAGYKPYGNSVAYEGDFCTAVNPNEGWFLHNSKGVRIYGGSSSRRSYHMNPLSTGWRAYMAAKALKIVRTWGWRSVFLDNVELSPVKTAQQSVNSDGTLKEFPQTGAALDTAFRAAWIDYVTFVAAALHAEGVTVYGNMIADRITGNSWDGYIDALDGGMFEGWGGYNRRDPATLDLQMRQAERALARGKVVLCIGQGEGKADLKRMRATLAQYLMIADGHDAYFRYADSSAYNEWWDYPELHLPLGMPTGPRLPSGAPGVWRREFENGEVIFDATAGDGVFSVAAS